MSRRGRAGNVDIDAAGIAWLRWEEKEKGLARDSGASPSRLYGDRVDHSERTSKYHPEADTFNINPYEDAKLSMVPNPAPSSSTTTSLPPLIRGTSLPSVPRTLGTDRTLLAPEDAIYQTSPPRKQSAAVHKLQKELRMTNGEKGDALRLPMRGRHKSRNRSSSRRRKGVWSKLLWVKQSYPDNYTDQATFLEHLQRNPRLQPYDFWPLVADSTVIVQHVCSVIIFIVCFVGIFQERVSPVAVVGWGSIATFIGWVLWDWWVGQEESSNPTSPIPPSLDPAASAGSSTSNLGNQNGYQNGNSNSNLARHSHSASASSIQSVASQAP
ncbi:Phosphatidylinositol N-acetylglucosaminyltransferase GPI2 subunit, partial [Lachnellula suecica]